MMSSHSSTQPSQGALPALRPAACATSLAAAPAAPRPVAAASSAGRAAPAACASRRRACAACAACAAARSSSGSMETDLVSKHRVLSVSRVQSCRRGWLLHSGPEHSASAIAFPPPPLLIISSTCCLQVWHVPTSSASPCQPPAAHALQARWPRAPALQPSWPLPPRCPPTASCASSPFRQPAARATAAGRRAPPAPALQPTAAQTPLAAVAGPPHLPSTPHTWWQRALRCWPPPPWQCTQSCLPTRPCPLSPCPRRQLAALRWAP